MSRMRHRNVLLVAAASASLVAGGVALGTIPAAASPDDEPPPILVEPLAPRSVVPDDVDVRFKIRLDGGPTQVVSTDDPSRIVVAKITVQPGAQFPWHYHTGPTMVTVAEGDFILTNAADCVDRPYAAGTTFVEPTGKVHTARNPGESETILYVTYFDAPASGPLSVTDGVVPPADCDIVADAADHAH